MGNASSKFEHNPIKIHTKKKRKENIIKHVKTSSMYALMKQKSIPGHLFLMFKLDNEKMLINYKYNFKNNYQNCNKIASCLGHLLSAELQRLLKNNSSSDIIFQVTNLTTFLSELYSTENGF